MSVPARSAGPAKVVAWALIAAAAAAALLVAAFDAGAPRSNAERAHAIAEDFACPVCQGQSVAESDVVVARNIRREIRIWVDEGRSEDFIREQLVEIYGDDVDYSPAAQGITALLWVLPVMAAAGAVVSAGAVFASRRRPRPAAPGEAAAPTPSRRRRGAWAMAVLLLAAGASALVARSSGTRSEGDAITGDIRASTRELLVDAQQAFASGDLEAALDVYDEALELSPANPEALAYKAWLLRISGDSEAAEPLIEEAVAIDPRYVDARVFAAAIALDVGDAASAAAHLDAFDLLNPPEFMRRLVIEQGLRESVGEARQTAALRRVEALLAVDDPPPLASSGVSVAELLDAAEGLAADERLIEGLELLQDALVELPADADLNAGYGWLLGRSAGPESPQPAGLGLSFVDRALELDPEHPEGLVYRAFLRTFTDDLQGGRADLAAFDALEVRPAGMLDLIDAYGLRSRLEPGDAQP